jgi:hypothetical protein
MNRVQRIVVVLYGVLLVYCCVWIPWRLQIHSVPERSRPTYHRLGYGWLWSGPAHDYYAALATPDVRLIELRLIVATSVATAAFILSGISRKSTS